MRKLYFLSLIIGLLSKVGIANVRFQDTAKWTILVYLDADNNLNDAGNKDLFTEMKSVGSNSNVNVVVQIDNWQYNSITTARRYYVRKDSCELLKDMGELDMGDPQTLVQFACWGMKNYPANHYLLVLWDHGDGWYKGGERILPPIKGICDDESSGNKIGVADGELRKALKEIADSLGRKIDIVAFDACLMGMIEVAQECKEAADIMVASEEVVPGDGWPYHDILKAIVDSCNGNVSSEEFSKIIVKKYLDSYDGGSQGTDVFCTHSAIKLGEEFANLIANVDTFAKVLIDSGSNFKKEIFLARYYSQEYDIYHHIDLYHFASIIKSSITGILQQSAQKVMNSVENVVLANGYVEENLKNSYGIAIYYPRDSATYDITYNNLVFANNTYWNEFISKWGRILYPPMDVFAGNGFNANVPLRWSKPIWPDGEDYIEQSFRGYKVYRGESSGGPYSLIATILKDNRVGNPLENFIDTEVNNGTTYYYVLTALYDDEESILKSEEVSATPNAPGYIKSSKFRTTQPTIDGVINAGEWSDAETLNIALPGSTSSTGLVYMKNDSSSLYIAVDNFADTMVFRSEGDFFLFSIYFDENHDHNWPPTDSLAEGELIVISGTDTAGQFSCTSMFRGHYGSYPDTVLFCEDSTVEGITISSSISTGHLQLEMTIDLTKSPLNAKVGDTIGISLNCMEMFFSLPIPLGEWPCGTIYTGPRSFGDLVLATSVNVEEREGPSAFSISQNYPNPFSLGTKIMYQIAGDNTNVSLKIFDISGRNVRDIRISHKEAGTYTIHWDGKDSQGKDLPNGIYFYRLETKERASIRKMTLIR